MKEIKFILKKDIPGFKVGFIYELGKMPDYKDEVGNYIAWKYSVDEMRQNNDFFKEF